MNCKNDTSKDDGVRFESKLPLLMKKGIHKNCLKWILQLIKTLYSKKRHVINEEVINTSCWTIVNKIIEFTIILTRKSTILILYNLPTLVVSISIWHLYTLDSVRLNKRRIWRFLWVLDLFKKNSNLTPKPLRGLLYSFLSACVCQRTNRLRPTVYLCVHTV